MTQTLWYLLSSRGSIDRVDIRMEVIIVNKQYMGDISKRRFVFTVFNMV